MDSVTVEPKKELRRQLDAIVGPFTVRNHEDYPGCDCSYVLAGDGSEVCTCYANASDLVAHGIAKALNAMYLSQSQPEGIAP